MIVVSDRIHTMLQLPLFDTPSTWAPPSHLPDLSHEPEIAIDTENKDPLLKEKGPGCHRKDGYVAGIGIAARSYKGYFPINHFGGGNLDAGIVKHWLRSVCGRTDCDYIFVNAQYDLGWLRTLGVEVKGRINDCSIADTLLDEERQDGFSLDAMAYRHLGRRKNEGLLREAAANYGLADPKADLWKLPARLVGPYGESDPQDTFEIWQVLKAHLKAEGLWSIYELERKVTPILFEMWWNGIKVDTNYAEELNARWLVREKEILGQLGYMDIWSTDEVANALRSEGITIPQTKKGNDSVKAEFLKSLKHPKAELIREARALNRTRSVYLEQNLIKDVVNGRIHPQYVQLASDEGGTRTGRLACKNPNAQQFPKRSSLFDAKSIRKCLIAPEGMLWNKHDYWSQEPVIQCHYGLLQKLPGAREIAEQFKQGIKMYTAIEKGTNGRCNYDQSKAVLLGRSYGMGVPKMSRKHESRHGDLREGPGRVRLDCTLHQAPVRRMPERSLNARIRPHTPWPSPSVQPLGSSRFLERRTSVTATTCETKMARRTTRTSIHLQSV